MQGKYIDQDGKTFEVTQYDPANKIAYAISDGAGQWYPEIVYITWVKSGSDVKTNVYEPEEQIANEEASILPPKEEIIEEHVTEVPDGKIGGLKKEKVVAEKSKKPTKKKTK